jgi:hypothetical protein
VEDGAEDEKKRDSEFEMKKHGDETKCSEEDSGPLSRLMDTTKVSSCVIESKDSNTARTTPTENYIFLPRGVQF